MPPAKKTPPSTEAATVAEMPVTLVAITREAAECVYAYLMSRPRSDDAAGDALVALKTARDVMVSAS